MFRPAFRIHTPSSLFDVGYRLADALVIVATLAATVRLFAAAGLESHLLAAAAAAVVYLLAGEASGLYRSWRGARADEEIARVVMTWTLVPLALLTMAFLLKHSAHFSRGAMGAWLLATPALLAAYRLALRRVMRVFRARGFNTRRYAVVGVTPLGIQLAENIEAAPYLGLKLAGFYDDRTARGAKLPETFGQRLGSVASLVDQARRGEVDMIFITFPMRAEARTRSVLQQLTDTTASVYLVPDFFVFELLHSRWINIQGLPAVSVFETPIYGAGGAVKRVFDLALAGAGLCALAPLMLAIALLIKLTSPGPVFFRQRRYGLEGEEIRVWKFRTMTVCEDGASVSQARQGDSRVTPLGALLRRTSLDELPQLFNVLQGTMSLVGPRPHASAHNEQYRKLIQGYMLRHKVKPGITGLAQVRGWRGETDTLEKMEKRVECDLEYIRTWSVGLDLRILLRTVAVVWRGQNAY